MKLSRGNTICLVAGGIILFFCFREWQLQRAPELRILGEKNALLVIARQQLFGFGETENDAIQSSKRAMTSYFSQKEILNIFSLENGQEQRSDFFSLQRISQNCIRGEWEGKTLFFFQDEFSLDEKESIVSSGAVLESDFWVLKKNTLPDFFPKPKEGILFVGERAPSQKVKTWAQENKIPLVTVGETGGFRAESEQGKWRLTVRD
jgi:hypothetical protein